MSVAPVALSCGEPAGVGPEIAALAWEALRGDPPFVWIGDPRHLPSGTPAIELSRPEDAFEVSDRGLPVLARDFGPPSAAGRPDPAHAAPVIEAIAYGAKLAASGRASALATAPISKRALREGAGFAYPGHTEYLADLGGVERATMMLVSDRLRVVPATIHVPLLEVPDRLTEDTLETALRMTHAGLIRHFGISEPRIAVAGLNPHAGEGGMLGREEVELIAPLVGRLREEGMALSGPRPADALFHAGARSGYDAAVCMYHDQALIPIKTLDFDRSVNVTLGLPFVRTSPDHGTAFDIAGKGLADPTSLIEAIRLAARMSATPKAA